MQAWEPLRLWADRDERRFQSLAGRRVAGLADRVAQRRLGEPPQLRQLGFDLVWCWPLSGGASRAFRAHFAAFLMDRESRQPRHPGRKTPGGTQTRSVCVPAQLWKQ